MREPLKADPQRAAPDAEPGATPQPQPQPIRLHEGQRACLKLVGTGMSTKEIARETGLSPATVDTYLKHAISLLGATNRREAARRFAAQDASQKSGSPPQPLSNPPDAGPETNSVEAGRSGDWLHLPPVGGSDNDLGPREKTLRILQIAVVGSGILLALTLLFAGVFQILK